jgi:cytochrome c
MSVRNARITLMCLTLATGGAFLIAAPKVAVAGDPAAGKSVFQASCSICHSVQPDQIKIGPTLYGVVGRKTGAVAGYSYSPANRTANLTWTDATLDKYLESPRGVMPGTKMTYAGVKDAEKRANLISYLDTLK